MFPTEGGVDVSDAFPYGAMRDLRDLHDPRVALADGMLAHLPSPAPPVARGHAETLAALCIEVIQFVRWAHAVEDWVRRRVAAIRETPGTDGFASASRAHHAAQGVLDALADAVYVALDGACARAPPSALFPAEASGYARQLHARVAALYAGCAPSDATPVRCDATHAACCGFTMDVRMGEYLPRVRTHMQREAFIVRLASARGAIVGASLDAVDAARCRAALAEFTAASDAAFRDIASGRGKRAREEAEVDECNMCYKSLSEAVVSGEPLVATSPCGHVLCKLCIEGWEARQLVAGHPFQCPTCDGPLTPPPNAYRTLARFEARADDAAGGGGPARPAPHAPVADDDEVVFLDEAPIVVVDSDDE